MREGLNSICETGLQGQQEPQASFRFPPETRGMRGWGEMDEVTEIIERCTVLPRCFSDFPVTARIKKPGPRRSEDLPKVTQLRCGRTWTRTSLSCLSLALYLPEVSELPKRARKRKVSGTPQKSAVTGGTVKVAHVCPWWSR